MLADNETVMLKNIHSGRGEIYAFLSRLFSNVPNKELYTMLAEISPKLETIRDNTDNQEIVTGIDGILAFIRQRDGLSGEALAQFDLERSRHYTTLFCLPKSIPTEESMYTSPEHNPRGDSYEEVLALFGRYRMTKSSTIRENEDFVGYELLFLSKLAYDCAALLEAGNMDEYTTLLQAQYDFHTEHFDRWVYDFYNTVVNYNINDEILYKYFAHFARGFMREDKATLKELLG